MFDHDDRIREFTVIGITLAVQQNVTVFVVRHPQQAMRVHSHCHCPRSTAECRVICCVSSAVTWAMRGRVQVEADPKSVATETPNRYQ